ncbi:hypothetical protein ABDI27_04475 [Bacillus mycoides]
MPFYMKKRGNNVTERLVDSSIVGFIINDNGYHLLLSMVFRKISKKLFIPLFAAVKLLPQNSAGAKKLGGSPAARKRPIGEG